MESRQAALNPLDSDDEEPTQERERKHLVRFKHSKLNTSSMKRLIVATSDGGHALKSEIAESFLRVKAVKQGQRL